VKSNQVGLVVKNVSEKATLKVPMCNQLVKKNSVNRAYLVKSSLYPVITWGLLTFALVGCNSTAPTPINSTLTNGANSGGSAPKPQVVVTTAVLCDLTQQVAGDAVNVTCLLPAGADPHTYRTTPQDAKVIASSQVIFYNGYNYEGSLIKSVQAAPANIVKVAVAEKAVPQPLMINHHDHDHADDAHPKDSEKGQSKPDSESAPDPHIWQDVRQGQRMTQVVETALGEKFPQHKETFGKNSAKYQARLVKLDQWIRQQTETIPPSQRKLITTHHAFAYYAKAYGLTVEAALLGVSTEEQATPTRLQELVRAIQQAAVPTIFAEATVNPKLMTAVAREAKVNLATSALFPEGTGNTESTRTYITAMVANTNTIVTGLGGKVTPFKE